MTTSQLAHFNSEVALLRGDESEQSSFSNFAKLFCGAKYAHMRIFLFNGVEFLYPDAKGSKALTGEFDQIIIDESKKAIIYTELKTTFSRSHAVKKRQFERFLELIRCHFPVGMGWKLVTAYGFTEWPAKKPDDGSPEMRPCTECAKNVFFVNDFQSIANWYDGLEEQLGKTSVGRDIVFDESFLYSQFPFLDYSSFQNTLERMGTGGGHLLTPLQPSCSSRWSTRELKRSLQTSQSQMPMVRSMK